MSDVLVIGAGVSGLTSAICLAEAGLDVIVQTARLPLDTTSVAAGAIWGPHLVEVSERVDRWGRVTLAALRELAGQPAAGIEIVSGGEVSRDHVNLPDWADLVTDFTPWPDAQLPAGFVMGWRYTAPVLNMPVYLGYLLDRFTASGGEVRVRAAGSLAEALADCPLVVNCTGISASTLVPDPELQPVRGQVVIVANPGIKEFFIGAGGENADLVYFFPHGDTVLLGGTEQHGNPSLDPDPETSRTILAGCAAIEPRLTGAEILAERVGLRPFRPRIRFGAERLDDGKVLWHNYGHGGAGVTLSWGCARDMTEQILRR